MLRVVTAYREQEPEAPSHQRLGAFDWVAAIRMMAASAKAHGCETVAITDKPLPVPHWCFDTREPQLMLWILEVSLAYLESDRFDRNTVFVSPDSLICRDLDLFDGFDLAILVRPGQKHIRRPLLNSIQWWPIAARDKLIWLFREALNLARELPENVRIWGGDTVPLVDLLSPIEAGLVVRRGLRVQMFDARSLMHTIASDEIAALDEGRPIIRRQSIIDFKCQRKVHMPAYFERLGL